MNGSFYCFFFETGLCPVLAGSCFPVEELHDEGVVEDAPAQGQLLLAAAARAVRGALARGVPGAVGAAREGTNTGGNEYGREDRDGRIHLQRVRMPKINATQLNTYAGILLSHSGLR